MFIFSVQQHQEKLLTVKTYLVLYVWVCVCVSFLRKYVPVFIQSVVFQFESTSYWFQVQISEHKYSRFCVKGDNPPTKMFIVSWKLWIFCFFCSLNKTITSLCVFGAKCSFQMHDGKCSTPLMKFDRNFSSRVVEKRLYLTVWRIVKLINVVWFNFDAPQKLNKFIPIFLTHTHRHTLI